MTNGDGRGCSAARMVGHSTTSSSPSSASESSPPPGGVMAKVVRVARGGERGRGRPRPRRRRPEQGGRAAAAAVAAAVEVEGGRGRTRPVVVIIEAAIVWFFSALFVASFLAEERTETQGLLLSEEGNAA
jgi:hypothetical protein